MYDNQDDRDWIENFKSGRTWARGGFVVLFMLALWFVRILLVLLAALQFGAMLITGRTIALALPFGRSLSTYVQEIALYVTFNSDRRPWPWSPWPEPGEGQEGDEFGFDDDGSGGEMPPEPMPRRKSASGTPSADDADDEPPAPAAVPGEPAGDDDGDDGTEPAGNGKGRSRKDQRNAGPARDDEAPAGNTFGEPPRPDA